ncbi:MAG: pyridoxamine 5'-phosphate oxidase family protein [Planctomycetes bacterium]|nr:pyridoxamine 5'-phosphate oxidase family protein [Planctomycetota bacterium]
MIDSELREFLQTGHVCVIATRDEELRPDWGHAAGVRVLKSRCVVFVEPDSSNRSLDNLRANGLIAVVVTEPITHRAIQLKGKGAKLRDLTAAEHKLASRLAQSARQAVIEVGIAPRVAATWNFESLVAVEFELTGVFEATPGPKAGTEVA